MSIFDKKTKLTVGVEGEEDQESFHPLVTQLNGLIDKRIIQTADDYYRIKSKMFKDGVYRFAFYVGDSELFIKLEFVK